ncbi:MAG TPA: C39 family peptidase [Nocardioidaceae bacterium]|nr:C39 family peptidase [Nocardioidaceae bacterium]
MRLTLPRTLLAAALTAVLTGPLLTVPAEAAPARRISYTEWSTRADFRAGEMDGVRVARGGALRIGSPIGKDFYVDPHDGGPAKMYEYGRWTSPWSSPGFALTELVPSWDARTRRDSWIQVAVRGRTASGKESTFDVIARWAPGDRTFHRTSSQGSEDDDIASVSTDTFRSDSGVAFTSWQVELTLFRKAGTRGTPVVDTVGAMTSRLPDVSSVRTSRPGVARGITLDVPRYSQMIHEGDYQEFGGGGEAWCSPTSTSMVLGYYDRLPARRQYAWVPSRHPNRFVDHAARMTFDYEYDGTGNWPFNTAYAAQYADHAFVTRLRNLRQAERLIKAGIPVIASVAFGPDELDGAPIRSTNGHLMVIVGFTETGDVVVNDPAAPRNRTVRRTYDRGQFENAWLPTSGGLVYVIRTADQELPARSPGNW